MGWRGRWFDERGNGTSCKVSSADWSNVKAQQPPEQKLHSVLTRCFPSTPFHHQTEKNVVGYMLFDRHGTPCLTSPESDHYSLAFLPHRFAHFPYSCIPHRYPYPFSPSLSLILHLPPFTSPFMSAGSASQFPPFSHSPTAPTPPAHFSSISMWRLFISEVPSWPDYPQPTYSLHRSLNGCSIKERGRERAETVLPSSYKRHPFGCRRSGMFHSEDCRS